MSGRIDIWPLQRTIVDGRRRGLYYLARIRIEEADFIKDLMSTVNIYLFPDPRITLYHLLTRQGFPQQPTMLNIRVIRVKSNKEGK